MTTALTFRPLGVVMESLEKLGFNVTYAYDDLVFVEHNAFLFQFSQEDEKTVFIHFYKDCDENSQDDIFAVMFTEFKNMGLNLIRKGKYSLEQQDNEEMRLEFMQ